MGIQIDRVGVDRVGGYEYHLDLFVDEEIIPLYEHRVKDEEPPNKTLLFEIRTNFIIRTNEGKDEITGSERFYCYSYRKNAFNDVMYQMYVKLGLRLEEYWMSRDGIDELFFHSLRYGRNTDDRNTDDYEPMYDTYSVIPVVVKLDVCTVQQNGESVEATKARAIRAENLIPLHICPVPVGWDLDRERRLFRPELINFLWNLPRIRVTEVNQGLRLMPVCAICSRAPTVGAEITSLHPTCSHAFHTGCIVRRLLETNLCPTCGAQAYDPDLCGRLTQPRI